MASQCLARTFDPVDRETNLTARPTTDDFIQAVQQAAASLAATTNRIGELEGDLQASNDAYYEVTGVLDDTRKSLDEMEAALLGESRRRERAENLAAGYAKRTAHLESQLQQALDDLARVSEAIASALGVQTP